MYNSSDQNELTMAYVYDKISRQMHVNVFTQRLSVNKTYKDIDEMMMLYSGCIKPSAPGV